jgi:hypothetical protein
MLLTQEREAIQSGGLGQGGDFTIAASAKAFEVLSSNLYQNKTLAVIREITCNAADAHTAAGLPLSSIKVHIPTYGEPHFSVRDFGAGLSVPDVMSLYTTYFRSTKDADNTQIGGFGLGSKSPFAVADQFTVTSWHGGQRHDFICYKDGGLPRVNHVGSAPSPEPTGLLVQVAAKSVSEWHMEARRFFSWWTALPEITGIDTTPFTNPLSKTILRSKVEHNGYPDWAILSHDIFLPSCVFMGLVPYTLNLDAIPSLNRDTREVLQSLRIFMHFPVGALSISPSREALSYDASTSAILTAKLKTLVSEVVTEFSAKVAAQPTLLEARKFAYSTGEGPLRSLINNLLQQGAIKWQGQPLYRQVDLDLVKFPVPTHVTSYAKATHRRYPRVQSRSNFVATHNAVSKVDWYWTEKVTAASYRTVAHHYFKSGQTSFDTILVSGVPLATYAAAATALGMPVPIDIATLEKPPQAERTTTATKTAGYVFDSNFDYTRTVTPIDLTGGGVYIPFEDGEPTSNQHLILRNLHRWRNLPAGFRVIGIAKRHLDTKAEQLRLALNKWVLVDAAYVSSLIPDTAFALNANTICVRRALCNLDLPLASVFQDAFRSNTIWKGAEHFFKLAGPYLHTAIGDRFLHPGGEANPLGNYASDTQKALLAKAYALGDEIDGAWKAFLKQHPMLQYANVRAIPAKLFLEYVNR